MKVGDLVLSRIPETGETAYKEVTAFIPRHDRIIWTVSLSGLNDASENFETTDEHPWWVISDEGVGSWKRTDELTAGMIVTTADNQTMRITSALETKRIDGTYNITVADFETYFVGENRVLVHNCVALDNLFDSLRGISKKEFDNLSSQWASGTFDNVAESISSHATKHLDGDVVKYMKKVANFRTKGARKTNASGPTSGTRYVKDGWVQERDFDGKILNFFRQD